MTLCPIPTATHCDNIENSCVKFGTLFTFGLQTHFSGRTSSHSVQGIFFEKVAFCFRKPPTDKKMNTQTFYVVIANKNRWSKSSFKGKFYHRVYSWILNSTFPAKDNQPLFNFFARAFKSEKLRRCCCFGYILPIDTPKRYRGDVHVF